MTQSATTTTPVHLYATRIRQNITIKPSTRLRQSPEPHRKLRPAPAPALSETGLRDDYSTAPETRFPSSHVVLHPDDATSRVFHSIARALLSVDNRAVTIKDLAEMCVAQGLACQNVSAASQAITTYIRSHLHRCEVQQDQPLLLRHVLSGTPSDDLLLPALHSKSGGAHQNIHPDPNTPLRSTNFRKGTMIWYLSRVTGAPCPFARAGIRLSDHVDVSSTVKDKEIPGRNRETRSSAAVSERCGQKRKRRSTRGCVRAAMSDDEDSDPSETETAPPPKVKLTLRLKPLSKCISFVTPPSPPPPPPAEVIDLSLSSDDEHDNEMPVDSSDDNSDDESHSEGDDSRPSQDADDEEWSMHSYPRRSISIPPYSPSSDHSSFYPASSFTRFRRSTSVPYSLASPPPDSEEDDDNTFSIFGGSRNTSSSYVNSSFDEEEDNYAYPSSDFDSDFEDDDNDAETSFESPGPRSPFSAPPLLLPSIVKQEPRDVQGILDAWDDIDTSGIRAPSTVEEVKATQVIGEAATRMLMDVGRIHEDNTVNFEPQDSGSDWDSERYCLSSSPLDHTVIKREVDSPDLNLDLNSPLMSFTAWRNGADLLVSPTSATSVIASPFGFRDTFTPFDYDELSLPLPRRGSESAWMEDDPRVCATLRPRAKTVASLGGFFKVEDVKEDERLTSLIASLKMTSQPPVLSPDEVKPEVKTEDAFFPPLPVCVSPNDIRLSCASQGSVSGKDVVVVTTCQPCVPEIFATDAEGISVYRTTIGEYTVLRRIDTDFVNLTPISAYSHGPQPVLSTIASAIVISKGSPLIQGTWVPLDVAQAYVCDHPPGLLDVFLSDDLYQQFPDAIREFVKHSRKTRPPGFGKGFASVMQAREVATQFNVALEEKPLPTLDMVLDEHKAEAVVKYDEPLNATEQEMFHALCVNLEWEKDAEETGSDLPAASNPPPPVPERPKDVDTRPLRRSKRVAAIASRTRSRRRESRNLS
ncbi:hypothetical protein DFS33DRAFT_1466414 [Desarmillaria ectypa]|nr:hypothetical protein DFS33DRAFT_1466414 [Desarmillaria ectypa]